MKIRDLIRREETSRRELEAAAVMPRPITSRLAVRRPTASLSISSRQNKESPT